MKRRFLGITCALLILSISIISWKAETKKVKRSAKSSKAAAKAVKASPKEFFTQYIDDIYNTAQLNEAGLDMEVFQKAVAVPIVATSTARRCCRSSVSACRPASITGL